MKRSHARTFISTVAVLVLVGFLGLSATWWMTGHLGGHGSTCLAATAQNADCPAVFSGLLVHLNFWKQFVQSTPTVAVELSVLAVLVAIALFTAAALLRCRPVRRRIVARSAIDVPRRVPVEVALTRWLAQHEASPSTLH